MSVEVRTDRISGYTWVDFYVDQSNRWEETVTLWPDAQGVGTPQDLTGYDARLVVIRLGIDETPVLDLVSPDDITVGGVAGTLRWDVPAGPMSDFTHPVYQHELLLIPGGDPGLAFSKIKGRVLVRASAIPPDSVVVPGAGWGHGPWGHFPWGH